MKAEINTGRMGKDSANKAEPRPNIEYTTDFVTSKDGTKIGYRILGKGNGIILVHGGLMGSQNFMELAKYLSSCFTVYLPDRRGRGLSSDNKNHSLIKEGEDIQALIEKTNTENIFGLSVGAVVTMQAALQTSGLRKIALMDPPVFSNWTLTAKWYQNYEKSVREKNYGKALLCIMKGLGESSWMTKLPEIIVRPLLNFGIKNNKPAPDDISLQELIQIFRNDYRIAIESKELLVKYKDLTNETTLLLEGEKSQTYLKNATKQLLKVLPNAKRVELPKCVHNAADNGENPYAVAEVLMNFFDDNR
ncbi:MAG: alpha/beta hydrolase [Prevotellaceae bacterium]|jgi:pimeloyl-ACP methyl ester carboxylesterase|nr:alpha/beta hydrolase [Prevotellaceae bacterium]